MPSLTKEEQERLIGPTMGECSECGADVIRQYCRQCDEFWFMCDCLHHQDANTGMGEEPHSDHRTYRWNPIKEEVVADSFNAEERRKARKNLKADINKALSDKKPKKSLRFQLRSKPSE